MRNLSSYDVTGADTGLMTLVVTLIKTPRTISHRAYTAGASATRHAKLPPPLPPPPTRPSVPPSPSIMRKSRPWMIPFYSGQRRRCASVGYGGNQRR